ncbi:hypothetical protein [Microbispora catharanthi]|uniref:hypothetical protein n=1 Tax=Microbispora catharanthi TaxID=1712871 RepID=UPI00197B14AB|nr:hypothetical protein [Microbispora catharanthi]
MRFGYGTNGFANHRLPDARDVIAGLGTGPPPGTGWSTAAHVFSTPRRAPV